MQIKKSNQAVALSSVIAVLLVSGFSAQVYANELDALLLPDKNRSNAEFAGVRFIELRYPQGSQLAQLFDGKNERIEFAVNGTFNDTQNGIGKVIQTVNSVLLTENKSPVIVENATLKYFVTVKGYPDRVQLAYRVEFNPTIAGYVLQKTGENNQTAIVDLEWRHFSIKEPLLVNTEKYGTVNVNYPVGLLQLLYPDLAQKLLGSEAKGLMEDPIMNFDRFGLSMKSWHYLFDVTGKQLERYGVFKPGEGGTVSIHSIGESSFREGTYLPTEKDATVSIDGTEVRVHASTPPPSGQITIAGYAQIDEKNGAEYAFVSPNSRGPPEIGFQFQVLLVFAGMMGAIATFVLFKARI